jgi:hypothetical protein
MRWEKGRSPIMKKPRTRSGMLAILVHEFLEKEKEDFIAEPHKIGQYRRLLEENLWRQKIDPHDPNWNFDSDLSDIAIDNPDLYPAEEISRANLEQSVNTIVYFHNLLKSFWDEFKKHLKAFEGLMKERDTIHTLTEAEKSLKGLNANGMHLKGMGQALLDDIHREREYSQEIQSPITFRINYSFETGKVRFFYSEIDAVRALMDLLKNIPIADFKKCKDDSCGKWFVMTSKRKRDFCCHLCAARYTERMKRNNFPEEFLKYHRKYYDQHLKKK